MSVETKPVSFLRAQLGNVISVSHGKKSPQLRAGEPKLAESSQPRTEASSIGCNTIGLLLSEEPHLTHLTLDRPRPPRAHKKNKETQKAASPPRTVFRCPSVERLPYNSPTGSTLLTHPTSSPKKGANIGSSKDLWPRIDDSIKPSLPESSLVAPTRGANNNKIVESTKEQLLLTSLQYSQKSRARIKQTAECLKKSLQSVKKLELKLETSQKISRLNIATQSASVANVEEKTDQNANSKKSISAGQANETIIGETDKNLVDELLPRQQFVQEREQGRQLPHENIHQMEQPVEQCEEELKTLPCSSKFGGNDQEQKTETLSIVQREETKIAAAGSKNKKTRGHWERFRDGFWKILSVLSCGCISKKRAEEMEHQLDPKFERKCEERLKGMASPGYPALY